MTKKKIKVAPELWYLYILECDDGNFYTGITKDLQRRLQQHITGKGAKYTRSHGAVEMVYTENYLNRSEATIREMAIKKLSRVRKQKLIQNK